MGRRKRKLRVRQLRIEGACHNTCRLVSLKCRAIFALSATKSSRITAAKGFPSAFFDDRRFSTTIAIQHNKSDSGEHNNNEASAREVQCASFLRVYST